MYSLSYKGLVSTNKQEMHLSLCHNTFDITVFYMPQIFVPFAGKGGERKLSGRDGEGLA